MMRFALALLLALCAPAKAQTYDPSAQVLLNTLTASNSATLSDTTSFTSAYDNYLIVFQNVVPVTNAATFGMQVHSGGAFQATSYLNGLGSTTLIQLGGGVDSTAGAGLSGSALLSGPVVSTTVFKLVRVLTEFYVAAAVNTTSNGGVWNGGKGAIDGVQFLMSSGNISTGNIKIYGLK